MLPHMIFHFVALCNELLFDGRKTAPEYSEHRRGIFSKIFYSLYTTKYSRGEELYIIGTPETWEKLWGFSASSIKKVLSKLRKYGIIRKEIKYGKNGRPNKHLWFIHRDLAGMRAMDNKIEFRKDPPGRIRKGGQKTFYSVEEYVKTLLEPLGEYAKTFVEPSSNNGSSSPHTIIDMNKNTSKTGASPCQQGFSQEKISKEASERPKEWVDRMTFLKRLHDKYHGKVPKDKKTRDIYEKLQKKGLKNYQAWQFIERFSVKVLQGAIRRASMYTERIFDYGKFLWQACINYAKYPENWLPEHLRKAYIPPIGRKIKDRLDCLTAPTCWHRLQYRNLAGLAKYTWACIEKVLVDMMWKKNVVNPNALLYYACDRLAKQDKKYFATTT